MSALSIRRIASALLIFIAVFLAAITIAGEVSSFQWWIRVWDFPRTAILLAALLCALGLVWLVRSRTWRNLGIVLTIAVFGWQAWRIFPYTAFAPTEVALLDEIPDDIIEGCFTAMTLNVYQENREYQRTIDLIDKHDPDLLFLTETDEKWADALTEVTARYPHRTTEPLNNTYGLMMLTRLPVDSAKLRYLVSLDIPSVDARLRTPNGRPFRLLGLHPRPPQPGQDVERRDAEIVIAARDARQAGVPVLTLGDFNDVAWSNTSQMFKRLGEFNDPRLGRGLYSTFPASWPFARWPLDHVFYTEEFATVGLDVLDRVGSDHLPVFAELCLDPPAGEMFNDEPDKARPSDLEHARETMEAIQ